MSLSERGRGNDRELRKVSFPRKLVSLNWTEVVAELLAKESLTSRSTGTHDSHAVY
jgi:hypothetical protein